MGVGGGGPLHQPLQLPRFGPLAGHMVQDDEMYGGGGGGSSGGGGS